MIQVAAKNDHNIEAGKLFGALAEAFSQLTLGQASVHGTLGALSADNEPEAMEWSLVFTGEKQEIAPANLVIRLVEDTLEGRGLQEAIGTKKSMITRRPIADVLMP